MKKRHLAWVVAATIISARCGAADMNLTNKTIQIPETSIGCIPGDYVLRKDAGVWTVFRVDSVVLLDRLHPLGVDGRQFVREIEVRDSGVPKYWGEVHLLVSMFTRTYPSEIAATSAIKDGQLADSVEEVCRSVRFFLKENSTVFRKPTGTGPNPNGPPRGQPDQK
jgi:hypothetical protein